MSEQEPDKTEIERRLDEMGSDIKLILGYLIGDNGNDGVFDRVTRLEERYSFLQTCYLWMLAGLTAMSSFVLFVRFRNPD